MRRGPNPNGGTRPKNQLNITARGGDFHLATSGDHMAIDNEFTSVSVPTADQENARDLVRAREDCPR